jgi:hypothetical protein
MAVVSVLNLKKLQHQQGSWFYLDYFFIDHLHFKAVHISSVNNAIADSLSRGQISKNVISLSKDKYFPIQQASASKPIYFYNRSHTPTLSV